MPKPTFQRSTIARVLNAAPQLKYVAVYHTDDDWLPSCIHNYQDRSFVYVLTKDHGNREYYLYAGKSKAQYARILRHMRKYAFDHAYIFECEPEYLNDSEAAAIRELAPMYNYDHNPHASRIRQILGIDSKVPKDSEAIEEDLNRKLAYDETCLYGFALPGAVYSVLEQQAKAANCTCSELLQVILERAYPREIARQIPAQGRAETNLISSAAYGQRHGKSQEQVKQYCHGNRIHGAVRIGRDWVIPRDSRFPEDHRKMGSK